MTDERESFHAAIWRTPDDDLPRLVYADWLDERNEHDAATFLRLLCAVRTCPPDVDKLRPLVADFRRAMMKLPPKWVEDVCPVPPAVIVGPWVDVEHEANQGVLKWLRGRKRRLKLQIKPAASLETLRAARQSACDPEVVERVWERVGPHLSLASACSVDGTPCLTDIWSGVLIAVCFDTGYFVRTASVVPEPDNIGGFWLDRFRREPHQFPQSIGPDWTHGSVRTDEVVEMLQQTIHRFDPANRST